MPLEHLWFWLEGFVISGAIRESQWLFPMIEIAHVLTLGVTVGTIALLDIRLLGLALKDLPVKSLADEVLPWTWLAFAATTVSGLLMFASAASYYVIIPAFGYKLLCLLLAGINMLVLHFGAWREVAVWREEQAIPLAARTAAALSLVFWSGVVIFGRWTGFF